jgi:hypothetical protein
MSANLQPFSSAGGFSTTANVLVYATHGNLVLGDASSSSSPGLSSNTTVCLTSDKLGNAWTMTLETDGQINTPGNVVANGNIKTTGSGGDITMSGGNITGAGNISLDGARINGGTATVVNDGINAIYTGATTTMDVFGFPFSQTTRGQLTISGDIDPTQALGTWYYQSTGTNAFEIFTDSTYTAPVDSTGWGAYSGGGSVAITKQVPAANIVINSNGYLSTFDSTGNLTLPGFLNTTGNITTGNILMVGNIGPSAIASPAPSINGFLNINSINVNTTSLANVLTLVTRNGDDATGTNHLTQVTFGWNDSQQYPQWVATRHNNSPLNNAIDFYTSDGNADATFPANAILGGSITQGAMQLAVYANATVRDSVITDPRPGMMIYVTGTGMQVRGATSWNTIAGSGS